MNDYKCDESHTNYMSVCVCKIFVDGALIERIIFSCQLIWNVNEMYLWNRANNWNSIWRGKWALDVQLYATNWLIICANKKCSSTRNNHMSKQSQRAKRKCHKIQKQKNQQKTKQEILLFLFLYSYKIKKEWKCQYVFVFNSAFFVCVCAMFRCDRTLMPLVHEIWVLALVAHHCEPHTHTHRWTANISDCTVFIQFFTFICTYLLFFYPSYRSVFVLSVWVFVLIFVCSILVFSSMLEKKNIMKYARDKTVHSIGRFLFSPWQKNPKNQTKWRHYIFQMHNFLWLR